MPMNDIQREALVRYWLQLSYLQGQNQEGTAFPEPGTVPFFTTPDRAKGQPSHHSITPSSNIRYPILNLETSASSKGGLEPELDHASERERPSKSLSCLPLKSLMPAEPPCAPAGVHDYRTNSEGDPMLVVHTEAKRKRKPLGHFLLRCCLSPSLRPVSYTTY